MYVIIRLFIKYNAYYIEKNTQHNAICYAIILQILRYFINISITIAINIITVKYIINSIKTYLLYAVTTHLLLHNVLHIV